MGNTNPTGSSKHSRLPYTTASPTSPTKDPVSRLAALQTGNPEVLHLISVSKPVDNALYVEGILHGQYGNYRVRGEWFLLADATDRDAVAGAVAAATTM